MLFVPTSLSRIYRLFNHNFHAETVAKDLTKELGEEAQIQVGGIPGIQVKCGDTSCVFEFITYKYEGKVKEDEQKEQLQPNNNAAAPRATNKMVHSHSLPSQQIGTPNQSYIGPQQHLLQDDTRHPPQVHRRSSMSGPYPDYPEVLHSPGNNLPDNDRQFIQYQDRPVQHYDPNRGGLTRGRAMLGEEITPAPVVRFSRGSSGDQGDVGRMRRRSSSSGVWSPPGIDPVSEEEEPN